MRYRVIIEVGYCEAFYDFDDIDAACSFASTALSHQTESEDTRKTSKIRLEIINTKIKEEVESD